MPEVLDWHRTANPRDAVERIVRALTHGELVALPTETAYVLTASALVSGAVERLLQSATSQGPLRPSLAVRGAEEALDFVPGMSALGRRLARRCWPGPVKFLFEGAGGGLLDRLPTAVREALGASRTMPLQATSVEATLKVLRLLPGPLVLSDFGEGAPATSTEEFVRAAGDRVDLVVDAGPSPLAGTATVVQVNGNAWTVLREGVVSREELERRSASLIVFVCTGNTCRSPLAEALCKRRLAERLGCTPEELPRRGFVVLSAGLAAAPGAEAAPEAVEVAREFGADLGFHNSRMLTADLAVQADYLVVMTRGHRLALSGQLPPRGPNPRLLAPEGQDVPDPIGRDQETYRDCARQIWSHLEPLVAELVPQS